MADKISPETFARWVSRHQIIMQGYKEETKTKADCIFSFGSNTNYCVFASPQEIQPGQHRFRPVVGVYATTASLLAGSRVKERISDYPKELYAYSFVKGDETIFAVWATEAAKTYAVRLPIDATRTMMRVGVMGDESIMVVRAGGKIEAMRNHDPMFLEMRSKPYLIADRRVVDVGSSGEAEFTLGNLGPGSVEFRIESDREWVKVAEREGVVSAEKPVVVKVLADKTGVGDAKIVIRDAKTGSILREVVARVGQ
jgi:hypothetical protein